MPSDEEIEKGDVDEDELEVVEEQVEIDYQIGEDLKEKVRLCKPHPTLIISSLASFSKIVPRAIDYFTGKALEYEEGFDDDDDDFEDIDDDDEDDDDHFDDVRGR